MIDLTNNNIIHIKKNNIEYIQFKKLLEYKNILKHAICFKPLNFTMNETEKDIVEESYTKICKELEISSENIIDKNQTHSDNVVILNLDNKGTFFDNTDGCITKENNIAIPIITADCIPFLLFDPQKRIIANIHSGWKGTVQRIIEKTVKMMIKEFKSNPSDIICCIGPSIGKCHFEVKEDVKEIFEKEFKDMLNKDIISNSDKNDSYYIDTILINKLMLLNLGLKENNIIESNICTVCNVDRFHSYRVEKENAGRNLSLITLI